MLRDMQLEDLDAVLAIEHELFTSEWKRDDFIYELKDNPFAHYAVIEENNEIIGFCGWWITFEQAQVVNVGVRTNYQRKGYGKMLMDKMVTEAIKAGCENLTLEVRKSNEKAIALYEKYGFINVAVRKGYYQDNHEDAYLMIKPLGGLEI